MSGDTNLHHFIGGDVKLRVLKKISSVEDSVVDWKSASL
jgi:hypothetical protein